VLDLRRDTLLAAGLAAGHIYSDTASGSKDERLGLASCLQSLREGTCGSSIGSGATSNLVDIVHDLHRRGRGLTRGSPARARRSNTTTAAGKLVAALAEFERELITKRTRGHQTICSKLHAKRPGAGT
jgi:DNA invertase Pin-like site-specific DNA recombinase